jgi:hypothetical protein
VSVSELRTCGTSRTAQRLRSSLVSHTSVIFSIAGEHDRLDHALGGEVSDAGLQDALHEVTKECLSFRCASGATGHHAGDVASAGSGTGKDLGAAITSHIWLAEPLGVARQACRTGATDTATAIVPALLVEAVGDTTALPATDVLYDDGAFV